MALAKFESLFDILKSDSQIRKNTYNQLQTCISTSPLTTIPEQKLLAIIKKHLNENVLVSEALATWTLYVKKSKNITEEFIDNVYQHSKDFDQLIPLFSELLTDNLLDLEKIISNNVDLNKKIINSLAKLSDKVPFKIYLDFINNRVVNTIYNIQSDENRNILIDFVLLKNNVYVVTLYNSDEQKKIATKFKNSYVQVIDNLRLQNNKNWYKLCMFTMKYCGKLLHSEIELTNAILRNVETGFKTKTLQDRLMAYECWKVLIDTCNLDHNYVTSNKQLRLLVKPLKVKLSKNDEIISKRFNIWFYLAHILREKLILCLDEFLRFCFELSNNNYISEICMECEMIENTWIDRVEVLMAIIGHSCHEGNCLKTKNFNFETCLISSTNFLNYDDLLINSIYIACKMISKWDDNVDKFEKVKCLWQSLFKIMQNLNDNSKESALHKISKVLSSLLQDSINNERNFNDIVIPIFSLLSNSEEPLCNPLLLHEILIFPIVRFMLSQPTIKTECAMEVVNLVRNVPKTGNKLFYFNRVCELLKTSSILNNTFVVHFWLQLSEELHDICKTPREEFNDFKEDAIFFLTWIFSRKSFEEMQNLVLLKWKNIFSEICSISTAFGETLLENSEKLVKRQPETINILLLFLPDIAQILLESKSSRKYIMGLLNVTFNCLQNPCTPKDKVIITVGVLKKIFLSCLNGENIEAGVVLRIYECVERLIKPHEVFEVVEVFKDIVPKLTNNIKKKIPNSLKQILSDLTSNSDTLISKDAISILAQLDTEENKVEPKPLFVKPITVSSRTAKIANMAKDNGFSTSPKGSMLKMFTNERKNNKKEISPASKCVSPRSRTKRIVKAVPTRLNLTQRIKNIDEDSGEFVLINKEVKLDKKKLNEHQRETMTKRREDIPALYQDLSQSQHSNTDINNSNSSNDLISNKSDSTFDENFKEMITDLKNKNNILEKNLNAELTESFKDSENSLASDIKNVKSELGNGLPKYDLNVNFEKALENQRNDAKISDNYNTIINQKQSSNQGQEANKDKPVFCSSRFEEKDDKEEGNIGAQAPIFPDYNLEGLCVTTDKSPKKKHKLVKSKSDNQDDFGSVSNKEIESGSDLKTTKKKLVRNRSMSESQIMLEKSCVDENIYEFVDDDNLLGNLELIKGNLSEDSKQPKAKTKEIRTRTREKHKKYLLSNKQSKTMKSMAGRRRRKSYEVAYRNDLKADVEFKKKYKSLENLNDMAKTKRKCFKIIQNDSELSNSIKLRISITDEKDNNQQSGILEQLVTAISKIDADLQNNSKSPKLPDAKSTNSESIFGSSEALSGSIDEVCNLSALDSIETNCDRMKVVLSEESKSNRDELDTISKVENVDGGDEVAKQSEDSSEQRLDCSFNLKSSEGEKVINTQKRKQRELERIKMDIVGADEFIVTTPRKRRAPKLLNSASNKKNSKDDKITNQTPPKKLISQKTSPQKKVTRKKVDTKDNSPKVNQENDIAYKDVSETTPSTSRKSLQFDSITKRKRKNNNVESKEVLENDKKVETAGEDKGTNDELLGNDPEGIINMSGPSTDANTTTPVNHTPTTKNVKRRSRLRTQVSKNTTELENTPKTNESTRKTRKSVIRTRRMSPVLVISSKLNQTAPTPEDKDHKDVNKNSLKSTTLKKNLLSLLQDAISPETMEDDKTENSENIIENSQDTVELLTRSRVLKKSQKSIVNENISSTLEEPISSSLFNISDPEENDHPRAEPQLPDASMESSEIPENLSEPVLTEDVALSKSPEQNSDNFICEINGVAINNINSEGSYEIDASETYVNVPDDTEVVSNEVTALAEADIQAENEEEIVVKELEADLGEKIEIKEEITIVNHGVVQYPFIHIKKDKDVFEDTKPPDAEEGVEANTNPDVTNTSDIKLETLNHNETLTCDPYIDVQNDEDVLEKLERDGPGAVRTVIRDLDFDSLPIVFDTTPKKGSIPGSPVCDDTPDRNKEFLKCTLDISPIKTESVPAEVSGKDAKVSVLFDRSYIKKPSSRSAKLLNLLPGHTEFPTLKPPKIQTKRATPSSETSTALSTQRIRQMILNCGKFQQIAAVKQDDDVTILDDVACEDAVGEMNALGENAVLKFTRELPSPLATPNSSILKKRKFSEIDECITPITKRRKRVNFSDPPTTSKKIYFMENEEKSDDSNDATESSFSLMENLQLTKADSIYPRLGTCTEDISEVVTLLNEDLLTHFHSINVKTVADLALLNETQINQLEFLSEPRLNRVIEALDIVYANYTEKEKALSDKVSLPVCPELITCSHTIQNILKFIGNVRTAKDFRLKGITTIGDLAKLTKTEVVQLSLKPCNILNALQKYQRRLNKGKILAKQMEEEMKEEAETVDLDETNVSHSSSIDSRLEVVEVKEIKEYIERVPDKPKEESAEDEECIRKRSVAEEIQYIKETYSVDEMRVIFEELKDILLTQ